MITYKEKLVMFVKLKKEHIEKFGLIYADDGDYEDIRLWSEEVCKYIYNSIMNRITSCHKPKGLSNTTCPWCVYHDTEYDSCPSCSYGKRHGICDEKNSLYKKYATLDVKKSITNEVYLDIINKIESIT